MAEEAALTTAVGTHPAGRAAQAPAAAPGGVRKLTVVDKIGYGFGDLASNLFWQMFSIFIAKYYTDVFLLGAATMGTMLPVSYTHLTLPTNREV